MNPSSTKPGLLLYFDLLPALRALPAQSVGELLLAAMEYARSGAEPAFTDRALDMVWPFLRSAADRDEAAYADKRQKGDWLVYCRTCKREGTAPLPFEQWKLDGGDGRGSDDGGAPEANGTLRDVDAALPTTTTTPTTAPAPATATASTTTPTTESGDGCAVHGSTAAPSPRPRDRAGLVLLTDGEYTALERELGKKELERTVGYLSDYCRLHGKRYGDWAFALRRASREGWGKEERARRTGGKVRSCQPGDDFQPSQERIKKNMDWVDDFLERQEAVPQPGA